MASLDARTDNFISTLIDVSGRVRPGDLMGVSEEDTAALLEAYRTAHPEKELTLVGGVLSIASVAQPTAGTEPVSVMPAVETGPPPAGIEQPPAEPAEQLPAWYFGEEAGPEAGAPGPSQQAVEPVPGSEAQEFFPEPQVPTDAPLATDAGAAGTYPGESLASPDAGFAMPSARVSPLWWLAVVFFGFLGAFVAWFANRGKSPSGAKPFLIVGIVLLVLFAAGIAAVFALGGFAMLGALG